MLTYRSSNGPRAAAQALENLRILRQRASLDTLAVNPENARCLAPRGF